MAAKKSPAVAAEAGKVKYWTTSRSAGCMLYLYGESGTTYLYIHLNNDVTMKNDNRGKCVRGTAYTVKNGAKVAAGQQIGYVGDSGDANGGASHLHFEVHPGGGKAVSPYPYLQKAYKLLFTAKAGSPFALTLTGTVVSAAIDRIVVNVSDVAGLALRLDADEAEPGDRADRAGDDDRAEPEPDRRPPHRRERDARSEGRQDRPLDDARTDDAQGGARRRRRAQLSADPTGLAADETGLALLDEGGHPLLRILAREDLAEGLSFRGEVFCVIAAERPVGQLLHQA